MPVDTRLSNSVTNTFAILIISSALLIAVGCSENRSSGRPAPQETTRALELEAGDPDALATVAALPDRNSVSVVQAENLLGWTPLMPRGTLFQLESGRGRIDGIPGEGYIFVTRYLGSNGDTFEIRQGNALFGSLPPRPDDADVGHDASLEFAVWSDDYQSFAEVVRKDQIEPRKLFLVSDSSDPESLDALLVALGYGTLDELLAQNR